MRDLIFYFLMSICTVSLYAQSEQQEVSGAFIIGEHEKLYEQLVVEHNEQLLSVCANSMDKAYTAWTHLLIDLEQFAEDREFDIKGTKAWINVFWNTNGTIRHIVYYPKPNSKNMDFQLLSDFLSDFVANYQFEITNERPFSHYGSATFPTFASRAVDK